MPSRSEMYSRLGPLSSGLAMLRGADSELLGYVDDRTDRAIEMLARVCRADLTAQPRLSLRHDRISETRDINPAVEQLARHRDRLRGVADDDRNDRMDSFAHNDSARRQLLSKVRRVVAQLRHEAVVFF